MGSGASGLYTGTHGSRPTNGKDDNTAKSSSVKKVTSVNRLNDAHSIPPSSTKNSVTAVFRNNHLSTERYYDSKGNAYLDIDYTDHAIQNCILMYRMNTRSILKTEESFAMNHPKEE